MTDELYREIILEHWQNPSNRGVVESPDFDVTKNNPLCGDAIRLTGVIEHGIIQKVAFEGEACAIAVAASSILSEYAQQRTVEELEKLTEEELLQRLELSVTPARTKCALLSFSALREAL